MCSKKSDKCRANLPMLVCNGSYLFDNQHILENPEVFHIVFTSEDGSNKDLQAIKEVDWFQLDSERPISTRFQFLVIPKREQACHYLDQHSCLSLRSYYATPTLSLAILLVFTTTHFTKQRKIEGEQECVPASSSSDWPPHLLAACAAG